MRTKIRVEQKYIDRGEQGHCGKCPVALAITEQTDLPCTVGYHHIAIRKNKVVYIPTPKSVMKFLTKFDFFNEGVPFNFFLYHK